MTRAQRRKRERHIDKAIDLLIRYERLRYSDVAKEFGLSVDVIRGRVERLYGSLTYARQVGPPTRPPKRITKCMRCKEEMELPRNIYFCTRCRNQVEAVHDGAV